MSDSSNGFKRVPMSSLQRQTIHRGYIHSVIDAALNAAKNGEALFVPDDPKCRSFRANFYSQALRRRCIGTAHRVEGGFIVTVTEDPR